jgi:hypothetical protein
LHCCAISRGSGDYNPLDQMPAPMHLCLKMAKKSVDEQSTAEYCFYTSSIGPQNVFPL